MKYVTDEMTPALRAAMMDKKAKVSSKTVCKRVDEMHDDTYAQMIDILGNPYKLQREGEEDREDREDKEPILKTDKIKKGDHFTINPNDDTGRVVNFEVVMVGERVSTGFKGVNLETWEGDKRIEDNVKTVLWADGSKGVKNLYLSTNPPKTWYDFTMDWVRNDLWGIARGKIFAQMKDLREFAEGYGLKNIDVAVGQSMMGIGVSGLAFSSGFENIQCYAYSGSVDEKLLDEIAFKWGLNDNRGANLISYTNEKEPLFKLYKPHIDQNKLYKVTNYNAKNWRDAHGAKAYTTKNKKGLTLEQITHLDTDDNIVWRQRYGKQSKAETIKQLKLESNQEQKTQGSSNNKSGIETGKATPVGKTESHSSGNGEKPGEGKGHWITTKEGNHVWIKDEMPSNRRHFCYGESYPLNDTEVVVEEDSFPRPKHFCFG